MRLMIWESAHYGITNTGPPDRWRILPYCPQAECETILNFTPPPENIERWTCPTCGRVYRVLVQIQEAPPDA